MQDGDVVVVGDEGFTENVSDQLRPYSNVKVDILDGTTVQVSVLPQAQNGNEGRASVSGFIPLKCGLGVIDGKLVAGTDAVIGITFSPATFGVGATIGLTTLAALGSAAGGAVACCF